MIRRPHSSFEKFSWKLQSRHDKVTWDHQRRLGCLIKHPKQSITAKFNDYS